MKAEILVGPICPGMFAWTRFSEPQLKIVRDNRPSICIEAIKKGNCSGVCSHPEESIGQARLNLEPLTKR